ncbi:hypothetical protein EW145_g6566 [Phellinidium pouzarii]|uniref:Uncharacterized protein n=1 Tax=Phellinidium pouzarii TaxID=167371 RepID=A0A4S4KWE4_9AGAM|nr:hypothetical protein EW145_g6566 [Phellinidium pouzarii]
MASADVLPITRDLLTDVIFDSPTRHEQFKATLLRLSPLVSIDRVKDQILFIGAWLKFYQKSEDTGILNALLSRGVYRFELWLTRIIGRSFVKNGLLKLCEVPPIDVAMMLHACILSPHRYYEDGLVRFPQLLKIGAFPLEQIAALINPRTYEFTATSDQINHWKERTGVPFDPLSYKDEVKDVTITCPSCEEDLDVAWEDNGRGYEESAFLRICQKCGLSVSHDRLRVAKFLKDLPDISTSDQAMLRGTLLNVNGDVELARARLIALHVTKALRKDDGSLPLLSETSMAEIFQVLSQNSQTKLRRDHIAILLRPYAQGTPFTHDLVKAVQGLHRFHLDLGDTGCFNPEYLSGPCKELSVACKKYDAFLELIAFPEGVDGAVPSIDLDLVWHTHQLDGLLYRKTVVELTGVYADHISCTEDPEFFGQQSVV